jgi:hypothetical protein
MNRPFGHVSRGSLQMFSGAAGLIAAFSAISLPLLALPGAAAAGSLPRFASRGTITILILTSVLAILACVLLRFSLLHEDDPRRLHGSPSHGHPHSA